MTRSGRWNNGTILLISTLVLMVLGGLSAIFISPPVYMFPEYLLTDPFLQFPTETTVKVVWFTPFPGIEHRVIYGENLERQVSATTTKLTRTREDKLSHLGEIMLEKPGDFPILRDVWRHEGEITGLSPGEKLPYEVISVHDNRQELRSDRFLLAPSPQPGTPLKILLTSDHQLKPMTAANIEKVAETVGSVDAIFLAGDLVNIPDRASEWFDDRRGNAFFPVLQGRAKYTLEKDGKATIYTGAALIQNAPLFPALGNHEIMGKWSEEEGLNPQFDGSYPRRVAESDYEQQAARINPSGDEQIKEDWIKNHSFNSDTYEQIFSLPESPGNGRYYAVTFGDIRLVVPQITNMWRSPNLSANTQGRFRERDRDLNQPENWGYGQHIFEPITPGSPQYEWLKAELNSPEFQQAKYKIVMFHHPPHSLGENIVPAYTDPVEIIDKDRMGNPLVIRYEYPQEKDYLIRDVIPLLEEAKVDLVLYGHSHLWNRFMSPKGMNFLETSNVGNTYGAYIGKSRRYVPPAYQPEYAPVGDPNGLEPILPTLAPLQDDRPLPYIASNDLTVFSLLDTEKGTISSYVFDTRNPESEVVKFDEFLVRRH
ncbi:metallophosphoesterase [Roseofilum sp. BLCC_M154]|uniref:Metallophosphoesterase n=1 Tax=Roseofilum acuticapitatum BLCC-M154 TaxID=3022444 RepID=A0ABT7AW98_9CYAN|nr:metallophosphoesterase [Roseofilum acuticapitatum]MDJ1171189.1 metallophosphoesterase [Roseofilum acuticapitatum BLCC-M154]